jgi:hypothetical protein
MRDEETKEKDIEILGKCTQHILELQEENKMLKNQMALVKAELETALKHLRGS